jgi:hypothetical protein
MTLRSFGWVVMVMAGVLAGSAPAASAAPTSIHQHRLNAFTGLTDDFGAPLVPIAAADSDHASPSSATPVGAGDGTSAAVGLAAVPGCEAATTGAIARLCHSYAFGFCQGVAIERSPGTANEDVENYSIVTEMLISSGGQRKLPHF